MKKMLSVLLVFTLFTGTLLPASAVGETEITKTVNGQDITFTFSQPVLGIETWTYCTPKSYELFGPGQQYTTTAYAFPFDAEITISDAVYLGKSFYINLYILDKNHTWKLVGYAHINQHGGDILTFLQDVYTQDPVTHEVKTAGTTADYKSAVLTITDGLGDPPIVSFIAHSNPDNYNMLPSEQTFAYPTECRITVNGRDEMFHAYALKDANGNDTTYIKLRDVAYVLAGTKARFDVGYQAESNSVFITTGMNYSSITGTEMTTCFWDFQPYQKNGAAILVNGELRALDAITLTDSDGNGHTYFKLRDLGNALGFDVRWNANYHRIEIGTGW